MHPRHYTTINTHTLSQNTHHDVLLLGIALFPWCLHHVCGVKGGRVGIDGIDRITLGQARIVSRQYDHLLFGQVKDCTLWSARDMRETK